MVMIVNIYKNLNEMILYIEENLEEEISYQKLAKFLGVNTYTMQRLFSLLTGISLAEYIRKRRLSMAGYDLYTKKEKIMDIAIKYQYENATSFSRAFEKFHGIKPSQVTTETTLKNYPKITFQEEQLEKQELDYEIIEKESFTLYGIGCNTNNDEIEKDAPTFFSEMEKKYKDLYGDIEYGMITYEETETPHEYCNGYYILYAKEIPNWKPFTFPKSKWLKFRISSSNAKDIREMSQKFYYEFLPSCKYNLKEIPELEYYHLEQQEEVTDFLVAIE